MAFGDYPKEYNPAVHGPYDPARYYGKKDIPLAQVKLSELGEWFSRRNKSPQSMVAACSRAWWRWQHKYTMPKKGTMAPIYQVVAVSMVAFYIFNYPKITAHRKAKYH